MKFYHISLWKPQWKEKWLHQSHSRSPGDAKDKEESLWNWLPVTQVASINSGQLQRGTRNHCWQWVNHNYQDLISYCPRVKEGHLPLLGSNRCFHYGLQHKAKVKVWWWKIRLDIINPQHQSFYLSRECYKLLTLRNRFVGNITESKIIVNFPDG